MDPNEKGGRENLEAVNFLQQMNRPSTASTRASSHIAEESTSWPKVSQPVHEGGLGFGFKWNMGFMHDTLKYMALEPVHRKYHHGEITFGLVYAFSENFVLPLSHDEVVHGKGTILGKMSGDDWQKFATLRAYYAFMWAIPARSCSSWARNSPSGASGARSAGSTGSTWTSRPTAAFMPSCATQLPLPLAPGAPCPRLRARGLPVADRR